MSNEDDLSTIKVGAYVIFRKLNASRPILIRVKNNLGVTVENLKFKLDNFIFGKPYGIYNVNRGALSDASAEGTIPFFLSTKPVLIFRNRQLQEDYCLFGRTRRA